MIMKMYSVFDSKLATFSFPRFSLRDESALRDFSDGVNDPQNVQWYKHPEDYSLFYVGEFDDQTGIVDPEVPKSLVTASALRKDMPREWKPKELVGAELTNGDELFNK